MQVNQLKASDRIALHQVKAYIENNIGTSLSIRTLARKHALNCDKLKSGFKLLFGFTIHQYIIRHRMEIAKDYLVQTDKPIKEIAGLVGCSLRNFFTEFKIFYAQTPGQCRREINPEGSTSHF